MGCCFPLLGRAEVAGQRESLVKVVEGRSGSWVLANAAGPTITPTPKGGSVSVIRRLLQDRKILMLTGSLEHGDISVVGRQ